MRLLLSLLCAGLTVGGGLTACGGVETPALNVYAAASLRDVLAATGADFFAETGVRVRISTGGSGLVAEQLLAGAPGDVFISAGELEVTRLVEAGRIDAADVRTLFSNQLVVIAPVDAPGTFEPADLVRAPRVSLAHPEAVPAGRYARAWLESQGLWSSVEPHVVRGLDARAALAAVASGGADLGIVYASDAARFDSIQVVYRIPVGAGPHIIYPGATLVDAPHAELGRRFLDQLGDRRGPWAAIATDLGFVLEP
jgi:molybdate transport system substrate-binding protein